MRDFPEADELNADMTGMAIAGQRHTRDALWIFGLVSVLSLLYFLLVSFLRKL
jgi:hypothetical protein